MTFPEKLTALRKQQGLSQEELAQKLFVSRQAVSRWESGATLPDAANLLQLSDLFGVTTDSLLRDGMAAEPFDSQPRAAAAEKESCSAAELTKPQQKKPSLHTRLITTVLWGISFFCFLIAALISPHPNALQPITCILTFVVFTVHLAAYINELKTNKNNR